ncbi:ParA family protein [Streptomyces luteolus]|uniref:ParA family protein n=1 Tax=Streptomyces luteolus TaxID=3043615 RepID=A0ABT6T9L3_9ACTN|nr:ParA family protein [Streptomyces sp. B-S-A12]MDI3423714.1 ParA family protein [Streptomyces sp. B-S-A12]
MPASVYVVSIDPQASTVWWANRINDLPFDFSQEHETPENLAVLKDTGAQVHVVANQKGGVGKTTTTLNLGAIVSDTLKGQDKGLQHVFIDTPGSLQDENLLLEALKYAHDVIVPMPPEGLAFDPTARTIQKVIEPTGLPFQVTVNNWDPRDGTADLEDTKAYIDAQGWPRAEAVIRRYKVHTRASVEGKVVTQYPKNRVAMEAREDFFRLALELGYGGRS